MINECQGVRPNSWDEDTEIPVAIALSKQESRMRNKKKHSSRMRTTWFPSSGRSAHPRPHPWMQTPLEAVPLDTDPSPQRRTPPLQMPVMWPVMPTPLWTEWHMRVKTLPCGRKQPSKSVTKRHSSLLTVYNFHPCNESENVFKMSLYLE